MVLESIINPFKAEKKPFEMFIIGFVYASVAIFLSLWIFESYSGLVMVFLTVLAATPLMYDAIKREEKKDLTIDKEFLLLKEHSKALLFFVMLFLGITFAVAFWYVVLPAHSGGLFLIQSQTISNINTPASGYIVSDFAILNKIFFNNVKVLIFCILFAFVYGVGAIFILTWNASVIGVAMGNFFSRNMEKYASLVGFEKIASYFHVGSLGILRYMIHGIPEVLAYFIGGLAGGIISIAIIRKDYRTRKFEKILLDASNLLVLAVVILFLAALIEVYITPHLF